MKKQQSWCLTPKTDTVWEHFGFKQSEWGEPMHMDGPICRICSKEVVMKKNTTNMHVHLSTITPSAKGFALTDSFIHYIAKEIQSKKASRWRNVLNIWITANANYLFISEILLFKKTRLYFIYRVYGCVWMYFFFLTRDKVYFSCDFVFCFIYLQFQWKMSVRYILFYCCVCYVCLSSS